VSNTLEDSSSRASSSSSSSSRGRARAGADAIEIVIADILGAPARRPLDGSRANEWRATGFPSPSRRRPRRTPRRALGRRRRDDATTTGDAR
jgi:hypothetical protein